MLHLPNVFLDHATLRVVLDRLLPMLIRATGRCRPNIELTPAPAQGSMRSESLGECVTDKIHQLAPT